MRGGRAQQGFTLFELAVVIIVIALLASSGLVYYQKVMQDARRTGVEVLAHRFTAAVALVHAQWILQGGYSKGAMAVNVDGLTVYTNAAGWPVNTTGSSTESGNQTAEECRQIWNSVLQNPAGVTVAGDGFDPRQQRYRISQVDGRICRYELVSGAADHYFDYNLDTGQVFTTLPPLS